MATTKHRRKLSKLWRKISHLYYHILIPLLLWFPFKDGIEFRSLSATRPCHDDRHYQRNNSIFEVNSWLSLSATPFEHHGNLTLVQGFTFQALSIITNQIKNELSGTNWKGLPSTAAVDGESTKQWRSESIEPYDSQGSDSWQEYLLPWSLPSSAAIDHFCSPSFTLSGCAEPCGAMTDVHFAQKVSATSLRSAFKTIFYPCE